jgi:hypothetical protein
MNDIEMKKWVFWLIEIVIEGRPALSKTYDRIRLGTCIEIPHSQKLELMSQPALFSQSADVSANHDLGKPVERGRLYGAPGQSCSA